MAFRHIGMLFFSHHALMTAGLISMRMGSYSPRATPLSSVLRYDTKSEYGRAAADSDAGTISKMAA
jgi:hypothetical protein